MLRADRAAEASAPQRAPAEPAPRHEREAATSALTLVDALIAIALGLLAGYACLHEFQGPLLSRFDDVWFGAETRRALQAMGARTKPHALSALHPLFVLISTAAVTVLRKGLSLQQLEAVALFGCSLAAFWAAALYALFRLLGVRRFDAALAVIAACCSGVALVVFVMPGPQALGAVTFALILVLAALAERRAPSWLGFVTASALGLLVQPLQVLYAGLLARLHRGTLRSVAVLIAGLAIVLVLGVAQKKVAPASRFPFALSGEQRQALASDVSLGAPLSKLRAALVHAAVLPEVHTAPAGKGWTRISVQDAGIGSGSGLSVVATVAWIVLLAGAGFALTRARPTRRLLLFLSIGFALQLLLVLGSRSETLPRTLELSSLMFVAIALATRAQTFVRMSVLFGLLVFIVAAGPSNLAQLREAQKLARAQVDAPAGTERARTRSRMLERPNDLWPRSEGHVVLAFPGSREADKSYLEPGGSFSPAFDSFGVSVWGVAPDGGPVFTSDTIAAARITQRFDYAKSAAPGTPPAIVTRTPFYGVTWSLPAPGRARAELLLDGGEAIGTWVLRSVGPAGGKVTKIAMSEGGFVVGDRYRLSFDPQPRSIALGTENSAAWKTERRSDAVVEDKSGWGYARVELGEKGRFVLEIEDLHGAPSPPGLPAVANALALELPDARFAASLRAQIAHLQMSLVGREPRPGDPNTYPLAWQRDGAYVLVALARAGQLELARAIATDFAEIDFFGGFGSEADAPGLSIWALAELARALHSPEFDAYVWPHVARKADTLVALRNAKAPWRVAPKGIVLPAMRHDPEVDLVADAARDGLINGRMDGHRPLLFVNAVSYRGFVDAAELAERLGNNAAAERYRAQAALVRKAWEEGLTTSEATNPRTYISGLWQSFVATEASAAYQRELDRRWRSDRTANGGFREPPLWTYFDIAEAHQWLFLGRSDRTWQTLQWFWNRDASRGLFTLWEGGEGGSVSSSRWEDTRGWLYPPTVTPHYWSAAELLLLQLDMLAYLDESTTPARIVIGAGVPADWLEAPFAFSGLYAGGREIAMRYTGKTAQVRLRGPHIDVKLAPSWKDIPLDLSYQP